MKSLHEEFEIDVKILTLEFSREKKEIEDNHKK